MTLEIIKPITIEEVQDGHYYKIETVGRKTGWAKAEVREEWTEVHPRQVYFISDELAAGEGISKIFDVGK